ncbi:ferritin-like domain-containing protein [Aspergillus fischeri NRRL 181]|uniref:Uncharacterized protein n=1 Tax=Neosartorya fischeri (strain ATCC 1020 / DSM 3700 / CBS 544.65 / FGSC A1164 / JCM 1740 / NRRL 181 / WB 181) TaxID=331117 RepID=A1DER8_NEOFI|nr:conserved hypothetical protein [Aspergillus fischeri NRRL 181]EAW17875.1 conserved hypothetical protein [Aspergillus fischeri NRRL 181]KAG2018913.1 hypothetical protein GB937_005551 [Aspergillus fischeri]
MHILPTLSGLLLAGAATTAALNNSYCAPKSGDVQVVQYAWAVEYMVQQYYASVATNQTFLNSAQNSSTANYASNLQGIGQQNRLGVRAAQQLGKRISNFTMPGCNFTFPTPASSEAFLSTAQAFESNASAALIGLEGYTQAPEVSFLIARLAAQHAGHAAYLATTQQASVFQSNVTSLVRAYSPSYVLSNGTSPGQLGRYFKGCVSAPQPPCGNLTIGPLIATFGNNSSSTNSSSSSSTATSGSASGTATSTGSSKRRFW